MSHHMLFLRCSAHKSESLPGGFAFLLLPPAPALPPFQGGASPSRDPKGTPSHTDPVHEKWDYQSPRKSGALTPTAMETSNSVLLWLPEALMSRAEQ